MAVSFKNILIGIFVLMAVAIMTFMLLFLHPSVGDDGKVLHVRFTDLDKVNVGTRVTYAGRPVGEVSRISEVPDARFHTDADGDVYIYEVELKVDSGVEVYDTDQIVMRTSGLLGERSIEIDPRPILKGQKPYLIQNEVLFAKQSGSVEETLKVFGVLAKKFDVVLEDFHDFMASVKKEDIVGNVSRSVQNVAEITDALNEPDKLKEVVDNFNKLSRRVNESWTTVDQSINDIHELTRNVNKSWTKVDRTLDQFYGIGKSGNTILAHARQGQGTIGELFMNDNLYLRLKSVLHKGETIMDDIKTYGILFQTDKRWQRLQASRLQLAKRLTQPNEFANYFDGEVDQISASLARVSMVLNESEYYPDELRQDPQVKRSFADLLKKVDGMQETLKLYNEAVIVQD